MANDSSSLSSVVKVPRLLLPRSARACSTQWPNEDGVRSKFLATSAGSLPWSSTRLTAPSLNSSVNFRRDRFRFFSSASMEHPYFLRKFSTKSDQAQPRAEPDHERLRRR